MTSQLRFSTAQTPQQDRSSQWNAVIADAYFPLQLHFRNPLEFNGRLTRTPLGHVGLSRLTSDPVNYERRRSHISEAREEEYLVTIPRASSVEFRQLGKDVRCDPGGFILERGDEPYRFMYEKPNDLFVLKVGRSALSERVRQPDRHCARVIDATSGTASLFATMVGHAQGQIAEIGASAAETIGRQLLELLGLALDGGSDAAESGVSSVRAAHLGRVERFIRANLKEPGLSPDLIAEGCGISKRYLHDLFKDVNGTVSQQIRDQRLIAARDRLEAANGVKIAEIAYRFGFSDQAQFARLFKAKFGLTPSDFQRRHEESRRDG
ncbi:helix-turn-helix domain-containing protein [Defluviimonas sp. WL0024]|uniref:Helix-turn-helix domain-containing protein n=2 Tax=Albidovulum TaxID=205889 RepID=A0ABT3JB08_9RHOB|nr:MULTISPECIES: helix-turn-helix domain-containing protein [Defluviimonas]MCU9850432.1 helix-turn-helix domain-containing protein [Defluviimonas sp. WL0024]MCW3784614.1 helix-turn-helix domain-containing protein [Defluviimonas salinarum]